MTKLKILKIDELKDDVRTGSMYVCEIVGKELAGEGTGSEDLAVGIVYFKNGARNKLHYHKSDQVLYILSGKGIVATEKEHELANPGMAFFIPAGEKHWHGAAENNNFVHISILKGVKKGELLSFH